MMPPTPSEPDYWDLTAQTVFKSSYPIGAIKNGLANAYNQGLVAGERKAKAKLVRVAAKIKEIQEEYLSNVEL